MQKATRQAVSTFFRAVQCNGSAYSADSILHARMIQYTVEVKQTVELSAIKPLPSSSHSLSPHHECVHDGTHLVVLH